MPDGSTPGRSRSRWRHGRWGFAAAHGPGPSIHVFNAARTEEYLRFDVFGRVLHYHYILNAEGHNVLWGYDPDVNGPMIPWVVAALLHRLPVMLRRAGTEVLADEIEQQGWDSSVLPDVAREAAAALAPREDDMVRAREDGLDVRMETHPSAVQYGGGGEY
ncbi:hypothetical protein ACFSLT_12685 [Novosphingobium resinovorum]